MVQEAPLLEVPTDRSIELRVNFLRKKLSNTIHEKRSSVGIFVYQRCFRFQTSQSKQIII